MSRASLICVSSVALLIACGQAGSAPPSSGTPTSAQSSSQAPAESGSKPPSAPEERSSEIPYTKDKLSYAGYSITVERKRVKVEEHYAENEVAVLKKNGRTIRAFDAIRDPRGAFARLALVPVLGGQDKHELKGFCDTADELIQAEQEIKTWQSENPDFISNPMKASNLYSKVLIHTLPLIYCGSAKLGWSFFDRLYNLPDREARKSTVKGTLRRDRVYRVIQNDLKRIKREASVQPARVSR